MQVSAEAGGFADELVGAVVDVGELHANDARERIVGEPLVVSTSFNDRDPIVESPADALATFQACDLDAACIGSYLVERS
ncbi:hypothetical protein OG864_00615 [Streptomyces sp. NBC_00124]|uniref:carbamoyltransferase C-terminal domain-containing protein n=1 Tax=Streptomyces sp. NBC_00124 TaxID=2975662 RepID=UPI002258746A|nr:carbamoyltransferase C-terminal domain-containing protein [Streptomyces sp. NBC_00124]MCX5357285.1 hypothetical protein [Streptomyces sp. NBC_00124]